MFYNASNLCSLSVKVFLLTWLEGQASEPWWELSTARRKTLVEWRRGPRSLPRRWRGLGTRSWISRTPILPCSQVSSQLTCHDSKVLWFWVPPLTCSPRHTYRYTFFLCLYLALFIIWYILVALFIKLHIICILIINFAIILPIGRAFNRLMKETFQEKQIEVSTVVLSGLYNYFPTSSQL